MNFMKSLQGRLGRVSGASWEAPESAWGHPGASWEAPGSARGRPWAPGEGSRGRAHDEGRAWEGSRALAKMQKACFSCSLEARCSYFHGILMVDLAHFGGPMRCLGALGGHFGVSWGTCLAHRSPRGGPGGACLALGASRGGPGESAREI